MPPARKKAAPKKRTIPRPIHLETTIPVLRPCRRCGVWTWAGVAEGMKAEVELGCLDTGQALWAVVNDLQLYCLRRSGLVHMDSVRLSGKHPGRLYPQHRCEIRWPVVVGAVQEPVRNDTVPY